MGTGWRGCGGRSACLLVVTKGAYGLCFREGREISMGCRRIGATNKRRRAPALSSYECVCLDLSLVPQRLGSLLMPLGFALVAWSYNKTKHPCMRCHLTCAFLLCSFAELLGELGQFYMRNGSRSRLSVEVRDSVLQHLEVVRAALPEEPKSLLGL